MNMIEQFRRTRRASVPLVGIETADPAATIMAIIGYNDKPPMLTWDCIRGLLPVNEAANGLANECIGNPGNFLMEVAPTLPTNSIIFLLGADEWLTESEVRQGLWNLRDRYKANGRTMVLLGPAINLPASLANDVIMLSEEYPSEQELGELVDILDKDACDSCEGRDKVSDKLRQRVIDSVRGLPMGAAENIISMNITKEGIDADGVWEAKRRQVEQRKGISIWRGGEKFSDICGLANLKQFAGMVINGRKPPKGIVFIDEIEKLLAGSSGDSSGVSQGFLQQLLTYMQDYKVSGMILIGPPGVGKSLIAKAIGNEAGIPTIAFDLNGMKGSLVGESEQAMRENLKVVTSVTGGESFWIATCNSISSLPPELRRRFRCGTFFVDLPDSDERESIWKHYLTKFDLDDCQDMPNDVNWSGAEIENCCEAAWRFDKPLTEVSQYIIPVYTQVRETIDRLRKECDGRYLAASYPGVYRQIPDNRTTRKWDLD